MCVGGGGGRQADNRQDLIFLSQVNIPQDLVKKMFYLMQQKFRVFHDLFFVEVSWLNGPVWIIIGSVCKLFYS